MLFLAARTAQVAPADFQNGTGVRAKSAQRQLFPSIKAQAFRLELGVFVGPLAHGAVNGFERAHRVVVDILNDVIPPVDPDFVNLRDDAFRLVRRIQVLHPLVAGGWTHFHILERFQFFYVFRYGAFVVASLFHDVLHRDAFLLENEKQDRQLGVSQVKRLQFSVVILLGAAVQNADIH